jgi:SAM-dependent methyltransferase
MSSVRTSTAALDAEATLPDFHTRSYDSHEHVWDKEENHQLASAWARDDTVDSWRHRRMRQLLDPLLTTFPGASWVTVGDGRYGTDAHYLEQHGADVMATDIGDGLLRKAHAAGFIHKYRKENAEQLSFADRSFDFALCKEAYHHMPRPMRAVYEMLRVARRAIVLIEPNQTPVLVGPRLFVRMLLKAALIRLGFGRFFCDPSVRLIDHGGNWFEDAGNFGYTISRREIERVALGLNYPHVAVCGINDCYISGVEYEKATPDSDLFRKVRAQIEESDRRCQRRGPNWSRHGLLVAVIFKQPIEAGLRTALKEAGYEVCDLPRNPYLG